MQKLSRNDSSEEAMKEVVKVSHGSANHRAITRVEFKIRVQTNFGDRVVVTGSVQELGFWEPRNGVELMTTKESYPIWTAVHHVPSGQSVEYKYVVLKADETLLWESSIDNRMFTAEGMVLVLEDGTFNQVLHPAFTSIPALHAGLGVGQRFAIVGLGCRSRTMLQTIAGGRGSEAGDGGAMKPVGEVNRRRAESCRAQRIECIARLGGSEHGHDRLQEWSWGARSSRALSCAMPWSAGRSERACAVACIGAEESQLTKHLNHQPQPSSTRR